MDCRICSYRTYCTSARLCRCKMTHHHTCLAPACNPLGPACFQMSRLDCLYSDLKQEIAQWVVEAGNGKQGRRKEFGHVPVVGRLPPVPNFMVGHVLFLESTCVEHESMPAPYCPGPTSVDTNSKGGRLLVPNSIPTSLRFVDRICFPTEACD